MNIGSVYSSVNRRMYRGGLTNVKILYPRRPFPFPRARTATPDLNHESEKTHHATATHLHTRRSGAARPPSPIEPPVVEQAAALCSCLSPIALALPRPSPSRVGTGTDAGPSLPSPGARPPTTDASPPDHRCRPPVHCHRPPATVTEGFFKFSLNLF
jgi:hypothetical protein